MTIRRLNEMSDEEWIAWERGEWDGTLPDEIDYDKEDMEMHPTIAGFLGIPSEPASTPITPANSQFNNPSSYTTQTYKPCGHTGLKACTVITLNGKKFELAGGSGMYTEANDNTRLIIDLAGDLDDAPWVLKGPAWAGELQFSNIPADMPVLRLNWADRAAPPVDDEWWDTLLRIIGEKYDAGRVTVACVGGHGRTGTALACMILAAQPDMTAEGAIETVRTLHCKRAIESAAQLWYIYDMRPGEEMSQEHKDEINPPKLTSYTSVGTATIVDSGSKVTTLGQAWCTWNTWCVKTANHTGRCKR